MRKEAGMLWETSQIQDLEKNICDMTAESLNFWLTKFIMYCTILPNKLFVNVNFGIKKLNCIRVVLFVIPVY